MTITALYKVAKYAILVLLILNNVKAQWSQASGSSSVNGVGSYGNIGEYRAGNLPPSRAASVWFSYDFNNGQKFFWVFGGATRYTGSSSDQYLNDLWVYNGQFWAWLAGSQSTNAVGNYGTFKSGTYTTTPGARTGSVGWTILENSSPVHYLFGGYGADGLRNDLWRWNGIWTWMNGSSSANQNGVYNTQGYPGGNSPGSRTESVSWTSPDNRMWLFGGYGYAASGQGVGLLNDLWYFNGVNWIWMDGSQTPNSGGTYGTVGTASASNQPGGRRSAASAFSTDSCTFYLFGGLGYGLNSQYGMLNDLWSYDCNTGQWTWQSGSSGSNPSATYGSQGTASVNYAPAGRQSASLVYKNGYLVLYGGVSYTAYYNDVWVFNTTTKTWAWVNGSPTSTQMTSTTIGSRRNAAAFVDNSTSNLWIYGGYGYDSANLGYLDSTWANSMTVLAPIPKPTTTGTATTATTASTSATTSATTATTSSTSATTSSTSATTSSTTSATTATTSTTSSTSSKGTTSTTSSTTGATTSSTTGSTTSTSTTGSTSSATTGSTSTSSSLTSGTSSTTSGSTTSDPTTSSTSSSSTTGDIVIVTTTGGSTTANSSQGGGEGTSGTSSSPTTGDTSTTGTSTNTSAGAITTPDSGTIAMNPVIIGSAAGAFVAVILILIIILVVLRRRRNAAPPPTDPERRLPPVAQKSVPIAVLSPVTSTKPSAQEMSPMALRRNSSYAPIRSESISSTTSFSRFTSRNNSIGNGTPLNRPPPPPGRPGQPPPPPGRPGQPPPPIMARRPSRGSSFSSTSTGYTIETHVDKYSVHYEELHFIKKIGKGSFGKVYLGEWEKMTVAVKICSTMDIAQINEFLEEAKLMMGMRPHPHVIQILGISTNGPHPAMILEYCSGGSLDKLVYSEQTMDPSTIVRIVHGIALGMHHLHRNNIIHRDLACRNILLSETNQPKIADFGLSRFLVVDDGVQTTQSDTLPLRWMAPESLRDRSYSYATDVWSFGILVSEIVNREPPHRTLDIITAAFRIRDEGMTPQLRDDCPSILRDLLQQCWYLDPEYRPSFEEICEVLKASEYVKTSKIPVEIVFTPEEASYM